MVIHPRPSPEFHYYFKSSSHVFPVIFNLWLGFFVFSTIFLSLSRRVSRRNSLVPEDVSPDLVDASAAPRWPEYLLPWRQAPDVPPGVPETLRCPALVVGHSKAQQTPPGGPDNSFVRARSARGARLNGCGPPAQANVVDLRRFRHSGESRNPGFLKNCQVFPAPVHQMSDVESTTLPAQAPCTTSRAHTTHGHPHVVKISPKKNGPP
jgi:hypothetical protein